MFEHKDLGGSFFKAAEELENRMARAGHIIDAVNLVIQKIPGQLTDVEGKERFKVTLPTIPAEPSIGKRTTGVMIDHFLTDSETPARSIAFNIAMDAAGRCKCTANEVSAPSIGDKMEFDTQNVASEMIFSKIMGFMIQYEQDTIGTAIVNAWQSLCDQKAEPNGFAPSKP